MTTSTDRPSPADNRRLPHRPPPPSRWHPAGDRPGSWQPPRTASTGRRRHPARRRPAGRSESAPLVRRPPPGPQRAHAGHRRPLRHRPRRPAVALDWLGTYDLPAGCSVAFYPGTGTKDGHGMLSRNFDFPTATLHARSSDCRRVAGERPLAADPWVDRAAPRPTATPRSTVGIMDVMGAMDGINEAGLAVALLADNETPEPEPTGGPAVGLVRAAGRPLPARHVRHRRRGQARPAARQALLLLHAVPLHRRRPLGRGRSCGSTRRDATAKSSSTPPVAARPLVCTNHLLHRWPDPAQLPADDGPIGTAALTYHRWRTLTAMPPTTVRRRPRRHPGTVRRRAVRSTDSEEARTFWHALYDVDDTTAELSFYLHDVDGTSVYAPPLLIDLTPRSRH